MQGGQGQGQGANTNGGEDLDPSTSAVENKKEASDWLAVFSSKIRRSLDVDLVHTLGHERWVFVCLSVFFSTFRIIVDYDFDLLIDFILFLL
jgi:hypothetical protein